MGLSLAIIHVGIVGIKALREREKVVADASVTEIGNLYGGGEDEHFHTHSFWIACLLIDVALGFFHAFHPFLGLQGNDELTIGLMGCVGVVVGLEGELSGILVACLVVGIVDHHFLLLALQTGVGGAIVPGDVFLIDELALLALVPDGALGLIDAYDVDSIVQGATLGAEDHLVFLVEQPAGLLGGVGLRIDGKGCEQAEEQGYNDFSHSVSVSVFSFGAAKIEKVALGRKFFKDI